jgi:hypothetical protein
VLADGPDFDDWAYVEPGKTPDGKSLKDHSDNTLWHAADAAPILSEMEDFPNPTKLLPT